MLHDIGDNEKGKDHWQHRRIHISTLVSMIVRILLTLLSHSLLCTYTRLHQTLRYQHNLSDSMTVRVLQVRVKGKGGNAIGARTSVRSAASMSRGFIGLAAGNRSAVHIVVKLLGLWHRVK